MQEFQSAKEARGVVGLDQVDTPADRLPKAFNVFTQAERIRENLDIPCMTAIDQ